MKSTNRHPGVRNNSNPPHLAPRMPNPHLYAVILAGGSGTRFWPLSRHLYPKQLLRIMGGETLIQQTVRRVLGCVTPEHIVISTNALQAESIRFQLAEWKDALQHNYLLEPEGRNTAPAIALAASHVMQHDPDGVMLVLPADHVIQGRCTISGCGFIGHSTGGRWPSGYFWRQADQTGNRLRIHPTEPAGAAGASAHAGWASGRPIC
jgi:Mannose-1-phosphate guanylyltransferase